MPTGKYNHKLTHRNAGKIIWNFLSANPNILEKRNRKISERLQQRRLSSEHKKNMSKWILTRKSADTVLTERLRNGGYVVIRLWEHDIKGMTLEKLNNKLSKVIYND